MRLAGLDIGYSARARTNALATWIDDTLSLRKLTVDERNAALASLPTVDVLSIDAPILPPGSPEDLVREVERTFARGVFQTRCKPGFSHVIGTGRTLREHGTQAAVIASRAAASEAASFPRVIPRCNVAEAFPNAFLGVITSDAEYRDAEKQRRGSKFDWLYDRAISANRFSTLAERCRLPQLVAERCNAERDHELRAALICLLTSAFAFSGESETVGDDAGGYFFLPPKDLWAGWAVDALSGQSRSKLASPRQSRERQFLTYLDNTVVELSSTDRSGRDALAAVRAEFKRVFRIG